MLCPSCGYDYSDSNSANKGNNRTTIGPLPHFGENYQISGKICHRCGFVAEIIKHPTGNPYHRRLEVTDPQFLYSNHDYYSYLQSKNTIEDFKLFLIERRKEREEGLQNEVA